MLVSLVILISVPNGLSPVPPRLPRGWEFPLIIGLTTSDRQALLSLGEHKSGMNGQSALPIAMSWDPILISDDFGLSALIYPLVMAAAEVRCTGNGARCLSAFFIDGSSLCRGIAVCSLFWPIYLSFYSAENKQPAGGEEVTLQALGDRRAGLGGPWGTGLRFKPVGGQCHCHRPEIRYVGSLDG